MVSYVTLWERRMVMDVFMCECTSEIMAWVSEGQWWWQVSSGLTWSVWLQAGGSVAVSPCRRVARHSRRVFGAMRREQRIGQCVTRGGHVTDGTGNKYLQCVTVVRAERAGGLTGTSF